MKYKLPFPLDERKFIYADDLDIVCWAGKQACTAIGAAHWPSQSFECQIMDWADQVGYAVHDLENSIHAQYIVRSTLQDDDRIQTVVDEVSDKFKDSDVHVPNVCDHLVEEITRFPIWKPNTSFKERKVHRKRLTSFLINRFIRSASVKKQDGTYKDLISDRYLYSIDIPVEHRVEVALINTLIGTCVFQSPQVFMLEEKAKYIVRCLFTKFMEDGNAARLLPQDWQEFLGSCCGHRDKARVVSDYISGMTDDYAQKTYAKLFLPNHGSIYEVV